MASERFVYVTYIASTPQKVWDALVKGEFTRQYWAHENVSDWKPGSRWQHVTADAERRVRVEGEVVEFTPPERLVLTWRDPGAAERSRVTLTIEQVGKKVRLTVLHDELRPAELPKIGEGWPRVVSSLKSLLETGKPLDTWS